MTTATKITLLRVLLIPVFMAVLLLGYHYAAMAVFIVASLTDFVDGYIARHYNQVTSLGKFLDPLADKLLVTSALLIYCQWGLVPAWAVMIVLTREFAVTGLRLVAASAGRVIAAGWSGKVKTFTTMVGICIMMVPWMPEVVNTVIVAVIVITTLYSGVEYFLRNLDVLRSDA